MKIQGIRFIALDKRFNKIWKIYRLEWDEKGLCHIWGNVDGRKIGCAREYNPERFEEIILLRVN